MRDVLAVASVIVLALGLGGVAAYMSVDLSPPGLELIRPQKPAVVAQIKRKETQRAVQAEASGCKYCASIGELAKTFSRRADTARHHASALRAALPQVSDETDQASARQAELKTAEISATRAEAAAVVLTGWASRCLAEDICKVPPVRSAAAACVPYGDPRPAAAVLIAMTVRNAAQACATASCPAVDCQASASLNADMGLIEKTLDDIGGRTQAGTPTNAAMLPVGPSTLKAELRRITDETSYVAKMLPLFLDVGKAAAGNKQLPRLAPEMIDQRAVSAAQLAGVMEQAAAVTDNSAANDPRTEASWRLKSLATHMGELGKDAESLSAGVGATNWERVADSLGGALLDLARLQAMLDRVSKTEPAGEGCDTSVAQAARQLREASAMLDLCRMRSACVSRGKGAMVKASGDANAAFDRARTAADALVVNDIGEQQTVQVADGVQPSLIEMVRSKGVCRRAGEIREAAVTAPKVAEAVAVSAAAPALTPTVGILAPQDIIAGAVDAAVEAPTPDESVAAADNLVQAAARFSNVTPRRKPRLMTSDPAVLEVASPRRAAPVAAPDEAYRGVTLPQAGGPQSGAAAFGGEGGPQQLTPPPTDEAASKKP
jgi:hypothetical protein